MPGATGSQKGATMKTIFLSLLLTFLLSGCASMGAAFSEMGEGMKRSGTAQTKTYECTKQYGFGNTYNCQ
jgi:uncharacterized protein YceK